MKKIILTTVLALSAICMVEAQLMNQAKDMSRGYVDMTATYFFADKLTQFDTTTGEGKVQ